MLGENNKSRTPILVDVEVEGGGKTREIHGLVSVQIGGKFRVDVGGTVKEFPPSSSTMPSVVGMLHH